MLDYLNDPQLQEIYVQLEGYYVVAITWLRLNAWMHADAILFVTGGFSGFALGRAIRPALCERCQDDEDEFTRPPLRRSDKNRRRL